MREILQRMIHTGQPLYLVERQPERSAARDDGGMVGARVQEVSIWIGVAGVMKNLQDYAERAP